MKTYIFHNKVLTHLKKPGKLYHTHLCALEAGVQHQVQKQLDPALHRLAGAEVQITAPFHVEPAEHRPPEAGIHGGDAPD